MRALLLATTSPVRVHLAAIQRRAIQVKPDVIASSTYELTENTFLHIA